MGSPVEDLLAAAERTLSGLRVEQVVIGIAYTAVSLSDGSLGLAASPREEGCRIHLRAGELAGMDATELPESPSHPIRRNRSWGWPR